MQVLGHACARGSGTAPEALGAALAGVLGLLRQSTEGALAVSAAGSRFYQALLHTLLTLLGEVCPLRRKGSKGILNIRSRGLVQPCEQKS